MSLRVEHVRVLCDIKGEGESVLLCICTKSETTLFF